MRKFLTITLGLMLIAGAVFAAGETRFESAIKFPDSISVFFGDGNDVEARWDGTDLDILAGADDSVIKFGTGTNSFDIWKYGNIATAYTVWDASASELRNFGPVRMTSQTGLSTRYELKWVAGQRGKPAINADIESGTEATREIADPDFELLGLNAVSTCSGFYAESGVVLTTTTGATDSVILLPHLDTSQTAWAQVTWGSDQQTEWECLIGTDATITNIVLWAGLKLTNTDVTATDDDQVFFRFAPSVNSGKWQAISSNAGTDTSTDSAVAVAASTNYHLKITIDSSRIARFYIDGVLVETTAALVTAKDFKPYIGVLNSSGAAHAVRVYGQSISRKIG
jgi:hypothetical protein